MFPHPLHKKARRGSALGPAVLPLIFIYSQLAHAVEKPEALLGDCAKDMVQGLFEGPSDRSQLRVLVARFGGFDDASRRFGMQVGVSLRDALSDMAQKAPEFKQKGLSGSNVLVKFRACAMSDHNHARAIGQTAGADVVLWGQTACDPRKPSQCQRVDLGLERAKVSGSNSGKDGVPAQDGTPTNRGPVNKDEPEFAFKSSLTVVNGVGLDSWARIDLKQQPPSLPVRSDLLKLTFPHPRMMLEFALGLYAFRADRYELAGDFFLRVKEIATTGVDGLHNLYRIMGISFIMADVPDPGLPALKRALDLCRPPDDECREVELRALSWAEDRLEGYAEAFEHLRELLALKTKRGDRAGEATTLTEMAGALLGLGEKQKAFELYNQALPLHRQAGNPEGEAVTLSIIGNIFDSVGEKRKALELFNQALPLHRQAGNRGGELVTLTQIGNLYYEFGEKPKAMETYFQALSLVRALPDRRSQGVLLSNIAGVYTALGERQKALELYNQVLPILHQVGDPYGEALTLSQIGKIYSALGEKQKALGFYSQALPLSRQASDRSVEAFTLNYTAIAYDDLGEKQKALDVYEQALAVFEQTKDLKGRGQVLDNMAETLIALHRVPEAIARYEEAAANFGQVKPPKLDEARSSLRTALKLAQKHRLKPQIQKLQKALKSLDANARQGNDP